MSAPNDGGPKTALIGRRPCGCVVAISWSVDPVARKAFEDDGYTVTDHTDEEATRLSEFNECTHGFTQQQLAAKVKELERERSAACNRLDQFWRENPDLETACAEAVRFGNDWRIRCLASEALLYWQPIETAPKDGSEIVVLTSHGIPEIAYWKPSVEEFCAGPRGLIVTHWLPLPKGPRG